ncbi:MAG: GFA family protein [Rhodospirillaceae bacterium]|jgi:hypothetical protein|nr:GFA family protein [Rhodospirillaceae bacterium]MBT6510174.1 GFA family protein [Rhodospirillaceae bacterium]MBT7614103.1 GFA family protein [Rhodospirillaceae bacterium]MBT7647863.1 GFA family protein [Rhodospirillaceae bacterium]
MNQTRPAVMTGGCQCGAVRYALYRSPVNPHICHCRMCQKAMGGPITAYAAVLASDFSWTRGAAKTFESSSIVTRGFCGDCGTPLSFRFVDDKWIGFTLATLDEPDRVVPTRAFGRESKRAWFDGLHALPLTPAADELSAEMKARLVSYQHEDGEG